MKTILSFSLFLSLGIIFSSFTAEDYRESTIKSSNLSILSSTQNGSMNGCWTTTSTSTLTYRLVHQGNAPSIQGNFECISPELLQLECGEWDLYVVLNGPAALVDINYRFPSTGSVTIPSFSLNDNVVTYVTQITI